MSTRETIHINSWSDLKQVGINALTGEACAFGMRLLCDLNEDGAALIRDYLGFPYDAKLADNWNSMVGDKPAVASVMLTREEFKPLTIFAMFRAGALAVVYMEKPGHGITGIFTEEYLYRYEELAAGNPDYTFRRNPRPGAGSRNTHAMSGRTV